MSDTSTQIPRRSKQFVVLGVLLIVVLLGVFALLAVTNSTQSNSITGRNAKNTVSETLISQRSSGATPELDWVVQSRDRLNAVEARLKETEAGRAGLKTEYQKQLNAVAQGYDEIVGEQAKRIAALETKLEEIRAQSNTRTEKPKADLLPSVGPANGSQVASLNSIGSKLQKSPPQRQYPNQADQALKQGEFIRANGNRVALAPKPGIEHKPVALNKSFSKRFILKDQNDTRKGNLKTYLVGEYLPSGSYAPAIVISGVDASVGIASQSAPKPVLMRITGYATTAGYNSGKGARINLKGCMVSGAATGDLSSERVYVRLTQMTCQNADASVFETKVAGHMVSAGKSGLRGNVVSREGPSVRSAAFAGVLEGLATGAESASGNVTGGLVDQVGGNPNVGKVLQSAGVASLGGGVKNAASTLADYYIKRAEQYQPVISMYAGSKVELVFMEGVHLK